jgi:hypothetical protein
MDYLDFKEIKTVIYTPSGYYGSKLLWNDASYAFKHRLDPIAWKGNEHTDNSDKWQFLTNNRYYLAEKLNVGMDVLPEWDYEFCVLGDK